MRKKGTRVEDENESLMMQLKKMATKARSMPFTRMCMIFSFSFNHFSCVTLLYSLKMY